MMVDEALRLSKVEGGFPSPPTCAQREVHIGVPGTQPIPPPPPTDHKAFYVIFTWDQEAQIYELVAQTVSERKK